MVPMCGSYYTCPTHLPYMQGVLGSSPRNHILDGTSCVAACKLQPHTWVAKYLHWEPPFVGLKNNLNSSIKGLILTKDHCVIPSGCCFTCLVSTQALRRRLQQQQRCWLSPGDLQPSQLRDRRKSKKWKGRSGKI